MTLSQALELADLNNPQLRVGEAQIDVARAGITTARHYPNPEVNFLAGRQTAPGLPGGPFPVYTFSQPLELGALRPARVQYAQRFRESSEIALAGSRLAVLAQVRRTFYEVLRRRAEIELAGENLKLVEDLRGRIQVRVEVGEAGRLELVRAEAEVATARTQTNSAQLFLVTAQAAFRGAVGAPLGSSVTLQGNLDPPLVLPPLERLREETLTRHPALQLARAEVTRADSRVSYEVAQRRPQPFFRAEVDYTNPSYRIGFGIPLPVLNQRQGPIAEAAAGLRQAKAAQQSREVELLAQLEGAYGRYRVAQTQLAAYEQGLLREAEEALRAAETAYQLGERGILEVLDAQRVLRLVRMNFLNAQFDRQAALVDLDELRAIDLRSAIP